MKFRNVLFLAAFLPSCFFCFTGRAETIYMRDGRVLKEKVTQKESYYVVTEDKKGIPHKYYMGQIDRIEEDSAQDKVDMENIDTEQFESIGMPTGKAKLIVTLIDVSGVRKNMEQNLGEVIAGVPDEQKEYYERLFNVDEIIERLIPLYDEYYTEKDLQDIIRFYDSPAGQKALEVTPKIMKESIGVSVEYFKEKAGM